MCPITGGCGVGYYLGLVTAVTKYPRPVDCTNSFTHASGSPNTLSFPGLYMAGCLLAVS